MTAKEKASDMITGWELGGMIFSSDNREKMVDGITRLLEEQDRDTRHACAESLTTLQWNPLTDDVVVISLYDAQAACINTRAF